AQEEGPEEATPLRGCSQSEPELREGGGASAEGNFFYLSLPTGPPRDPPRPGGDIGDTEGTAQGPPGDTGDPPRGDIGDTELILGTLEELRGKLLRLRALEVTHRQLLRSLGGADATPTAVPAVPRRAPPPPSPCRAPRGHGGTATHGTGET
ncbi:ARHGB factor, partial [Drymodes brunneopygia]|nr:ARHGB factor [Drymodes brunneopygia]